MNPDEQLFLSTRGMVCDRVYECSGYDRPTLDKLNSDGTVDRIVLELCAGNIVQLDSFPRSKGLISVGFRPSRK